MNLEDLPDESESSDEDYVPEGISAELPSEEESDGDPEDVLTLCDDTDKRGTKRKKGRTSKKKRRTNLQGATPNEETPIVKEPTKEVKEQTSALWADFIKDTGFKTRAERSQPTHPTSKAETEDAVKSNKPQDTKSDAAEHQKKVKVTEVYKFAGEEVKIEKEVDAGAAEARLINTASSSDSSRKPAGGGRINSILNNLGKTRKITTLEKSKLDWEQFKKDEDIGDELHAYSKSKDGYLERQDFLQRADVRRFEIEKDIRTNLRNNRMNNIN